MNMRVQEMLPSRGHALICSLVTSIRQLARLVFYQAIACFGPRENPRFLAESLEEWSFLWALTVIAAPLWTRETSLNTMRTVLQTA